MTQREFSLPVRIYWEDTDAGGIVYHANYLRYMERARGEMLRDLGCEQHRMQASGEPVIVVADASLKFHRPAKLDDLLTVRTRIKLMRSASVVFEQKIFRGETLLVTGEIRCAAVDKTRGIPVVIPEALRSLFSQTLSDDSAR